MMLAGERRDRTPLAAQTPSEALTMPPISGMPAIAEGHPVNRPVSISDAASH